MAGGEVVDMVVYGGDFRGGSNQVGGGGVTMVEVANGAGMHVVGGSAGNWGNAVASGEEDVGVGSG